MLRRAVALAPRLEGSIWLRQGRAVGFAEYGVPLGTPVPWFHDPLFEAMTWSRAAELPGNVLADVRDEKEIAWPSTSRFPRTSRSSA
jgi:hypothetical protein